MKPLIDMLGENKMIPMHMPGHKRNTELAPYLKRLGAELDITEISGYDNLHAAVGILAKSMEKAACMRKAERAFYLVNGSTCGILAAVCAHVKPGDKVICARNCHKAVYNALMLSEAEPIFVMPKKEFFGYGEIMPGAIGEALENNPDARLVIVTSPTYEGVISDLKGICEVSHKYGTPVLVDAAHGAHLGYGHGFAQSAVECGADISVESLHKTLPSLTQTAICYVSGILADGDRVAEKLAVFETSSPSYLLMASIDGCINLMAERGDEIFANWQKNLDNFYKKAECLKKLQTVGGENFFDKDRSKIVVTGASGPEIESRLKKRGIEIEMTAPGHIIAMTGAGEKSENIECFANALSEIDKEITKREIVTTEYPNIPPKVMKMCDAESARKEQVDYLEAIGKIAAEAIFAYPPGVPLIVPGEIITPEHSKIFADYENSGINLKGSVRHKRGKILIVCS